jgi:formyltetrahydrofolate hydrolase
MSRATILFSSPDRPGLVARLSGFFFDLGLNILEASNYTDLFSERGPRFYMRLVVDLTGLTKADPAKLGGSATRSSMETTFAERVAKPREGRLRRSRRPCGGDGHEGSDVPLRSRAAPEARRAAL